MDNLTNGKKQGLEKITTDSGKFKVLALDQNNSFKKFLNAWFEKNNQKQEASDEDITNAKMQITRALSPEASAVLLDGQYGLNEALKTDAVFPGCALIGRLEKSVLPGELAAVEKGWSVEKLKNIGCSAIKVLVYMDCENEEFTKTQINFIKKVYEDCTEQDILLMIEELTFVRDGEDKNSTEYLARKSKNIIQSAKLIEAYCDILKLEFPGDDKLKELNSAISKPWVLLSAGEDYNIFEEKLKKAIESGCSGFMAGRALFKEYFDTEESHREQFLKEVALDRIKKIGEIVDAV